MKRGWRDTQASERWTGIAFLGAAALAAFAALEPLSPPPDPDPGRLIARASPAMLLMTGDFLAAPPFDPARRRLDGSERLPVDPPLGEAEAEAPEPTVESPVLAGILGEGAARKVLFVGATSWLGTGAGFRGWTLAEVAPRRVVLRRGEEELVLDAFRR